MTPESAWKATLGELELQMTRATFNTWLRDAQLLECRGNEYVIGVRSDYAKDWLENRLQENIARTLTSITGDESEVRFVVGDTPPAQQPAWAKRPSAPRSERTSYDLFNSRYTFKTFVVGQSNRLAHAAALSVAEQPGKAYNPLFIYGGVGLGKTHLLHAIGHHCLDTGFTIRYVSSEDFTNDLIQAIRGGSMDSFREKYRTPDVLLIDDIQFIAGKEGTQEEFFHTFNHLHANGRQVVLSSDRPPKAMVTLEERLQSRFEWGLMADIQLPDEEMRSAILHSRADEHGVYVPESVIELITHHFRSNIRELEGALNKVVAYSQLMGQPVTLELVNVALADQLRAPVNVTVDQVIDAVIAYYGLSRDRLVSASRSRSIAFPRQMAMYLARTETDASFPQIGKQLGDRDHTTVMHGYEKISAALERDEVVRRDLLQIKAMLYQSALA